MNKIHDNVYILLHLNPEVYIKIQTSFTEIFLIITGISGSNVTVQDKYFLGESFFNGILQGLSD